MINKVNSSFSQAIKGAEKLNSSKKPAQQISKTAEKAGDYLNKVNHQQAQADMSVKQMLAGNEDISTVVAKTAEADMSFKLLVGVRNKLVEAYKQTMNMKI